jgi:murein DD-endopeptidase MepM/ murein hydrolase activator NlpD
VPIDGVRYESFKGGFAEKRSGHMHEAVDILAPRNTPVKAAEDGTIAKLFVSKAGGITIYQFDRDAKLCFYYAHLERYADNLKEGLAVSRGDVIGYVGTTGNAPPNTPHLHFAIFEVGPDRRWWQGQALDPYHAFDR